MPLPILAAGAMCFIGGAAVSGGNNDHRIRLAAETLKAMKAYCNDESLYWDNDGLLGVTVGSAVLWLKVIGDDVDAAIEMWSPVVSGISPTSGVWGRLNQINSQIILGSMFLEEDEIHLRHLLCGNRIHADDITNTVEILLEIIDAYDGPLSNEFGGETSLPDPVMGARHSPMR